MKIKEYFRYIDKLLNTLESQKEKNVHFSCLYLCLSNYDKLTYNQEIADILLNHKIELIANPLEQIV